MNTKSSLIDTLNLLPHPEGGYYRETYRSQETCTPQRGVRSVSTGIYFLLGLQDRSRFHVIASDEMWHHYDGAPLEIHEINPQGEYIITLLGSDLTQGQVPQYTVSKGHIFGSKLAPPSTQHSTQRSSSLCKEEYTLVGCTVAPGFDFNDFTLFSTQELISQYPHLHDRIHAFFKNGSKDIKH